MAKFLDFRGEAEDSIVEKWGIVIANVPYLFAIKIEDQFEHIVSMNDPWSTNLIQNSRSCIITFPDDSNIHPEYIAYRMSQLRDYLVKTSSNSILLHCEAGISRSAAATVLYLMLKFPEDTDEDIVHKLLIINPFAFPNTLMMDWICKEYNRPNLSKVMFTKILTEEG